MARDTNEKWFIRLTVLTLLGVASWSLLEVYANAKDIAVQEERINNVANNIREIKDDVKEIKKILWRMETGGR